MHGADWGALGGALINLRRIPTGRRRFALRQVRAIASELQLEDVVARCDAALAHDDATARLEATYSTERRAATKDGTARAQLTLTLDGQIDGTLAGLDDKLSGEIRGLPVTDPEVRRVEGLRTYLFPSGVGAITSLSYVEELHATKDVLARGRARQDELSALGAGRLLDRLGSLLERFDAALNNTGGAAAVGADQVRAADLRGNRHVAEVVTHILFHTLGAEGQEPTDAQLVRRQALLGPILAQNQAMLESNRQRRRPTDVNPSTGEELPESDEGAPSDA